MMLNRRAPAALLLLPLLLVLPTPAQEHKELGRMWTFENPPLEFWKEAYGFEPTKLWLDHARLSSLRYGSGCSASFVSPRGLVMTNNHCARGDVASVSPEGTDWLATGFFAASLEEEVPVPGLSVQQLVSMEDVTERMNEGLEESEDDEARAARLKATQEAILKEAEQNHPGLQPQVVSLYHGGMYQLYLYKVYNDVRLVAFPHLQAAKFGGDPDNFTYPRYSLDYAFVRAWEDGKPADTSKHYFKWRTEGPKEGDAVFVTGNPGSTGRLDTVAQMEFMRDILYPRQIGFVKQAIRRLEGVLAKGEDPKARNELLQMENARKAFTGYLDGLKNEQVMEIKRKAEARIREKVAADPKLAERFGDAWEKMEDISRCKRELFEGGRPTAAKFQALGEEEALQAKRIGEAFFAVYGTSIPPDATFTLRISDGVVKGFPYNGTIAPWFTSLWGLYARHCEFEGKDPFDLPELWLQRRDRLDMTTRFNLVSTCDIIGGNSGSPMINTDAEVVGLVFDGNIESLGNRFVFTEEVPRTVSVHTQIIIESLRNVYDRPELADEIEGRGPGYK